MSTLQVKIPEDLAAYLTEEDRAAFQSELENRLKARQQRADLLSNLNVNLKGQLEEAARVHGEIFGIAESKFMEEIHPYRKLIKITDPDFSYLHVRLAGVTFPLVCGGLKKVSNFSIYDEDRIGKTIKSDLLPDGKTTILLMRDVIEADEQNKGLSFNQMIESKQLFASATDRLMMSTRKKLTGNIGKYQPCYDIENPTLTSSVNDYGCAVFVYWYSDHSKVGFHWIGPSSAYGNLRARSAVSLMP